MLRHRELVLAHAEAQLVSKGKMEPTEMLGLYKKFLKIENHRLQLKHYAGGGGREIARQRSELVDIVLRHLYDAARKLQGAEGKKLVELALVATGGYGRGELNPFSDVDILFLHDDAVKSMPSALNEMIQLILYMLWDVGFKVGHATRSISGAITHANSEMLSKTALLESRLITGDKQLFSKFRAQFEKHCVVGHEKTYIEDRLKNQAERHEKHGSTVYMQEPNIKNGCGGLRDYQNLLWMSYFKERILTTAQLVEHKLLRESERKKLDMAYDFLVRVRTELHYLNKRALDVLSLSFQFQIANKWAYPQENPLRRSEAFMRDYYQHARTIFHMTNTLAQRLAIMPETQPARRGIFKFLGSKKTAPPKAREYFDGFYSKGGQLYPESREVFKDDPYRLIRLFQHAQQRRLELSPELQHLISHRLRLVDRTFQYSRVARETFAAILSRKGEVGRILRMMHEVDFLGRYMPEFGPLTCLVQHEFFHRYTADEHTLVCIEKLDALIDTDNPKLAEYKTLFQKLEDPFVLYLSLLLHDTGKASNARQHAEASALCAQQVSTRHHLSSERRKSLILLVDNHIALSSTAQRRNLDDPATIAGFAALVKNRPNLDMLMLLTLVDGQGTGDEAWSDWKESLVWHLYNSTSQYLADSEAFYRQRRIEREELQDAVTKKLAKDYEEEINAHFHHMPESYFLQHTPADIAAHIRLVRSFLKMHFGDATSALGTAMEWIPRPERGHSEVWICTWDRTQLLAKIAGALAVTQLNILSADIYTRGDNIVLDIFRVCDTQFRAVTDEKEMAKVEKYLHQALAEEEYDFAPLLERVTRRKAWHLAQELDFPTRITIVNDAHPVYTLVDVQAPDRLGLLYNLLCGLSSADVNIALSRITTEKGAAIDSFYVTGADGQKIKGSSQISHLQRTLQRAAAIKEQ